MDYGSTLNGAEGTTTDAVVASLDLSHRRSLSGGVLSKLSFLRASADENLIPADSPPSTEYSPGDDVSTSTSPAPKKTPRAMSAAMQQQKTRRRKGSLRKAALLGRGAQREKNELETSPLTAQTLHGLFGRPALPDGDGDIYVPHLSNTILPPLTTDSLNGTQTTSTSPTLTYTSTTDEEDMLTIPKHLLPLRADPSLSSGSESYFPTSSASLTRRRSQQNPTSPLSVAGLTASPLPPDEDWDYAETEWWGWLILSMTWLVFVIGMGSCFGVWSWAWDVGETPYAPPELEDDPTLPIVGYYPALIILTAVMAWVWVVVAWVGMKYFRHAKISGD